MRQPNFAALNRGRHRYLAGDHHVGHWPTFLVVSECRCIAMLTNGLFLYTALYTNTFCILFRFVGFSMMAYSTGQTTVPSADKKFLDLVISDLISLSYECKRKYPPVKEVCDVI